MVVSVATLGVALFALLGASQSIPQNRKAHDCPELCPANYDPVCGSDGKTYGNVCELGIASCTDASIIKKYDGECREASGKRRCPEVCPRFGIPVCGSDGKSYAMECHLDIAACTDPSIKKVSTGTCPHDCPRPCPEIYDPVCGSDGKTYGNECEWYIAACLDSSILKKHDGECRKEPDCPEICPALYAPVCGSNGKTYSNECMLNVAACQDKSITKVSDGDCAILPLW